MSRKLYICSHGRGRSQLAIYVVDSLDRTEHYCKVDVAKLLIPAFLEKGYEIIFDKDRWGNKRKLPKRTKEQLEKLINN